MAADLITGGVFTAFNGSIAQTHTTASLTPLSGDDRVACIFIGNESGSAIGVDSVTWNGQSATLVGSFSYADAGVREVYIYRILEADYPSTAGAVVVTYSRVYNNDSIIIVAQCDGVDQTTPFGTVDSDGTTGTSITIAPSSADDGFTLCFCTADSQAAANFTQSGGTTIGSDGDTDMRGALTGDASSSGSPISVTFSVTSSDEIQGIGVALNPAATATNVAVGLTTETDSAFDVTESRLFDVGLSSDTETAQSVTGQRVVAVGLTSETDSPQDIAITRIVDVGLASETDSAFNVTPVGASQIAVGLASETDSAADVAIVQSTAVGLSEETDSAFEVVPQRVLAAGLASETDSAQTVTLRRAIEVGLASETDTALSILLPRTVELGLAEETDSALRVIGAGGAVQRRDTGGGAGGAAAVAAVRAMIRKRREEEEKLIMELLKDG